MQKKIWRIQWNTFEEIQGDPFERIARQTKAEKLDANKINGLERRKIYFFIFEKNALFIKNLSCKCLHSNWSLAETTFGQSGLEFHANGWPFNEHVHLVYNHFRV